MWHEGMVPPTLKRSMCGAELTQLICDDAKISYDFRKLCLAGFKGLRVDGILIRIVTTPCHFGGERRWFLCPNCNRRCAVLYKPKHRCRLCMKGRYRTESLSPLARKIEKIGRLRRKLGEYRPDRSQPLPPKPPRMRWETYDRLCYEIATLEHEVIVALNGGG